MFKDEIILQITDHENTLCTGNFGFLRLNGFCTERLHDNKVQIVDEYKNFALLILIAPFCPCFINLVYRVF